MIGPNPLTRTPNLSVYSDESGRWARSFCGNLPVTGLQVEHVAPSIVFLLSSSYVVMTLGKNTGLCVQPCYAVWFLHFVRFLELRAISRGGTVWLCHGCPQDTDLVQGELDEGRGSHT